MLYQRKEITMTKQENQELLGYLEEFLHIATNKIYGYEWFMSYPYLKLCNDTFSELLLIDLTADGL